MVLSTFPRTQSSMTGWLTAPSTRTSHSSTWSSLLQRVSDGHGATPEEASPVPTHLPPDPGVEMRLPCIFRVDRLHNQSSEGSVCMLHATLNSALPTVNELVWMLVNIMPARCPVFHCKLITFTRASLHQINIRKSFQVCMMATTWQIRMSWYTFFVPRSNLVQPNQYLYLLTPIWIRSFN